MSQSQWDVDKHDDVADHDGGDITVALAVDLIFNAPLCIEWDGQVGVVIVLHKVDKPVEVWVMVVTPESTVCDHKRVAVLDQNIHFYNLFIKYSAIRYIKQII